MVGGAWSMLAAEARRIADGVRPLEPATRVCPYGASLGDGRHLIAAADRELQRAVSRPASPSVRPGERTRIVPATHIGSHTPGSTR
jgi:hypothetical protein